MRSIKTRTPFLSGNFDYARNTQKYHLKRNTKFKARIDPSSTHTLLPHRLVSRRMEHESYHPTFDDIVLHIMPLLKNGVTPEHQTILSVLEDIAKRARR